MNDGDWFVMRTTGREQLLGNLCLSRDSHQDHDGSSDTTERVPINIFLTRHAMTRDNGETCRHFPMCDRNTGDGRCRNSRRDTRHHLVGNAGFLQGEHFFTSPSEHERIPTLQTNHRFVLQAVFNQQGVDVVLLLRFARNLPDVDAKGILFDEIHHFVTDETVVDDDIGSRQEACPPKGQQLRISGPGAHQIDRHSASILPLLIPDYFYQLYREVGYHRSMPDVVTSSPGASVQPLTQAELVKLAQEWAPRMGANAGSGQPAQRWYVRLEYNDVYEVWLMGWSGTTNTEFHDHGGSAGAVAVIAGEITEARLRHGGSVIRRTFTPGSTLSFGQHAIHDVQNAGNGSSLTVHVYSPPLTKQTYFAPDVDGVHPVRTVDVYGPEEGALDLTEY